MMSVFRNSELDLIFLKGILSLRLSLGLPIISYSLLEGTYPCLRLFKGKHILFLRLYMGTPKDLAADAGQWEVVKDLADRKPVC